MQSTVQIIETQADMNRMFESIVQDFKNLQFDAFMQGEQRRMAELHASYFASATGPSGKKWPELAPATIKRKGHATILVETTRLRQSLTNPTPTNDSTRDRVDEFSGAGAGFSFGTNLPYSPIHNFGLNGMKQREHTGITESYFSGIVDRTMDFAFEGLKQ